MAEHEKSAKAADPFEPFRALRDAYLDSMARSMVETVNTEAYAQATGAMLEGYLSAAGPFREALEKSMVQTLQQLSLPSRQEVAALAERFTHVEMRLDDMDAKLDKMIEMLRRAPAAESRAEPPAASAGENGANPAEPELAGAAVPSTERNGTAHHKTARKSQR